MSDESEEACLVNPKSPTLPTGGSGGGGLMPYTDGVQTFSQYGAQMNSASRMGSGSSPNIGNASGGANSNGGGGGGGHYQQGAVPPHRARGQSNDSSTGVS